MKSEMEKKKNKKQLQTFAENGHSEKNNNSLIDLQSLKKKKKKKKENEDINNSLSQESTIETEEPVVTKKKKKKREQQELEESPRKKKKSNKEQEVESPHKKEKSFKEEENAALQTTSQNVDPLEGTPRSRKKKKVKSEMDPTEEAVIDEDWWPPEERTAMLEAMKVQVTVSGRFSKAGYMTSYRKTNWEDVLNAMNSKVPGNSRTVEQCKVQFKNILHKIGTIKSLNQILDEGLSMASDPGALRREVVQARHRFVREYMGKNKGDKDCTMMAATKKWKDLPEVEKEKWEEEYQKELRQKGLTDAKSKKKHEGPENCRHPFELYLEARAAKGEVLSPTDAKSKYATLSLKKKMPFIVESLKQQKVYEAEAANYLEKNPTWKKTKAHGPTVKEVKDYLESVGLPLAPPNSHIAMYYQEEKEKFTDECANDSIKVKSVSDSLKPYQRAREALSNLPQKQQDKYKLEWRKSWIEYLSEVDKWKPLVEENHPEILEQALAALAAVKVPNLTEGSDKKKAARKLPVDPLSNIERQTSALTNVKFNDEPKLPSRTGYELFVAKFKKDAGASFNQSRAKELWGKLTEEKKAVYTDRVEILKQRAKAHYLSYASELEGPQKKLYVGVKRDKLVKYFQEDIFAEDYPGTDYPILISAPKTPKKGTDKGVKDTHSSEDDFQPSKSASNLKKGGTAKIKEPIKEESEDEDEDDEEENEEEVKENESSSSDNDSDSESEVEASQPTPISPFSLSKSGKNVSRSSNAGNSSPFSVKLPPKDESSDSENESEDESDSDNNKENYETPVSSRAQSKTKQRSGLATSTPAVKGEMTSDSEQSSSDSSDSEDVGPAWKNTSSTATPNRKRSGLATSTPAVKGEMTSDSEQSSSDSSDSEDVGPAWKNTSSTATPNRKGGSPVKKEESSGSSEEESD